MHAKLTAKSLLAFACTTQNVYGKMCQNSSKLWAKKKY